MRRAAIIQLTLWAASVRAFFPFIPTYACDEYHDCDGQSKRALPANEPDNPLVKDSDPGELLTFKLSQRRSPVSLSHLSTAQSKLMSGHQGKREPPAVAARQLERLRRKFGFVGVSTTASSSKDAAKRDNTFSVVTAATPTATNSVGISQDGSDISYFVEATIGSSGQAFYLLCDTGAGSTWIMGTDCDSTACKDHTTWSSSSSTTFTATGDTFSIAYGTGSVAGSIAQDSVTIGSVKVDMKFGLANITSNDFTHFAFDGILGLSMASGSSDNYIQTIKSDKALSSNVFSIDLNRNSDGTNTGELTFGGTDPQKYTGAVTYTPVNSSANGDWAIPLGDLAYDGTKAGITNRLAYIDTGTTYAFAPSKDVAALHKLIPGANSTDGTTYTAPCDSKQPIVVTFSGVDHPISVKDWLSSPSSTGVCTSNIYGQEVVSGAWLLGDVFLKNVYTIFDADASQIGEPPLCEHSVFPMYTVTDISPGFATKATTTTTTATATTSASASTSAAGTSSTYSSGSGSTTAAAESAGATQTAAKGSGGRLEASQFSSILCVLAVVARIAY